MNAVAMSHRLGVLICITRCRSQVAADEHNIIKFSLPGNRVDLKTIGPPSLPFLSSCRPDSLHREVLLVGGIAAKQKYTL